MLRWKSQIWYIRSKVLSVCWINSSRPFLSSRPIFISHPTGIRRSSYWTWSGDVGIPSSAGSMVSSISSPWKSSRIWCRFPITRISSRGSCICSRERRISPIQARLTGLLPHQGRLEGRRNTSPSPRRIWGLRISRADWNRWVSLSGTIRGRNSSKEKDWWSEGHSPRIRILERIMSDSFPRYCKRPRHG